MHRTEKQSILDGIIMAKVSIDYRSLKENRAKDGIRRKHGCKKWQSCIICCCKEQQEG